MDEPPSFASIDLEAAREALPDNLYWDTAAPTQDPRLLGDRERAKTRWNEQYGKVLSGTGTEEEIKEFFDHRMHLSSDTVRFVDWVIEHQGAELSEQDLTLLHVAKRLHLARLEEVPRRMQEAFDRKVEQDAAREAWLAEQREFEAEGGEPPPAPDDVQAPDAAPTTRKILSCAQLSWYGESAIEREGASKWILAGTLDEPQGEFGPRNSPPGASRYSRLPSRSRKRARSASKTSWTAATPMHGRRWSCPERSAATARSTASGITTARRRTTC
jgi:hypothetical protein